MPEQEPRYIKLVPTWEAITRIHFEVIKQMLREPNKRKREEFADDHFPAIRDEFLRLAQAYDALRKPDAD